MSNLYKSGSVWRKWDLHVHTPLTKLNNQYKLESGDVWDIFCDKIENSDVGVFGITDYFSVDNYVIFCDKFKTKYPKSDKQFFPNIEFRIDSINSKSDHIQIHVIFSNKEETLDKLSNFFTRLKLVSTDNETLTSKYCTQADLTEITYEKAMVKLDVLTKHLQEDFSKEEYLIVGVANGYGSLRPENGNGRSSEYAKEIDKSCDAFFGNKDNVDFFLNKIAGRDQYALSPKAVLSGCDAHSFEQLDDKLGVIFSKKDASGKVVDSSEITWIKADPTFEGLRQIIFEPEDRVRIQELIPDEKDLYRVIDKVQITDTNFTTSFIEFNPNLNVIIGSRSSGKTTLLNSIAKAVDVTQFRERSEGVNLIQEPPEAKVFWLDGTESSLNEQEKGVIYIPQNYINNLAEATEGNSPILAIAEKALFDNENNISQKRIELNTNIESINHSINNDIYQFFVLRKQVSEQAEKIKKIGDKKGIEKQIEKINAEIAKLHKDLTKEELVLLTELRKNYAENSKLIENLKFDQEVLALELLNIGDITNVFTDSNLEFKSEELAKEFDTFITRSNEAYIKSYDTFIREKQTKLEEDVKKIEAENKKILSDNSALIAKANQNKSAEQKIKDKEIQDKKLLEIGKAELALKTLEDSMSTILVKILESHKSRSDIRKGFSDEVKGNLEGIEFSGEVLIDNLKLNKYFSDHINFHNSVDGRPTLNAIAGYKSEEQNTQSVLVNSSNIKVIIDLILNDTLKTKSGIDIQKAVEGVLSDFEFINYSLKYEDDSYSNMTPGKKSLVVLKLLVESSNDKYPILIDQPEDDLDSRSISSEIVDFLRNKKKDRQIILVTHNANIAIKADAEEIIVANRNGQQHKNKDSIMFDYVTGAIENSFSNSSAVYDLDKMGIREHACELLEGGEEAFENRRNKYNLK